MDWVIAPDLPVVQGDALLLREVWANLLGNAYKYTRPRERARIEVGWSVDPAVGYTFFVRDNGVGFDTKYASRSCSACFSACTGPRSSRARASVWPSHGASSSGTAAASGLKARSVRAACSISRYLLKAAPVFRRPPGFDACRPGTMSKNADAILLVEDNPDDAELTKSGAGAPRAGRPGHPCVRRHAGAGLPHRRNAFTNRSGSNPVLVLLDLKMPLLDGIGVLKEIKGCDSLRNIPVVVLTSSTEPSDLLRAYDAGTNAYIAKPTEFSQFLSAMKHVCEFWININQTAPQSVRGRRAQLPRLRRTDLKPVFPAPHKKSAPRSAFLLQASRRARLRWPIRRTCRNPPTGTMGRCLRLPGWHIQVEHERPPRHQSGRPPGSS